MVSNVVITSKDKTLSCLLAALIADRLGLFYLSFSDLVLYNANRPSRKAILSEGGTEWFYKLLHGAAKDLSEYETTSVAIDFDDFDYEVYLAVRNSSVLCYVVTDGDDTDTDGFDVVVRYLGSQQQTANEIAAILTKNPTRV